MWGIIPAAGAGTRIQPLAFSKELLPVGGSPEGLVHRPRAVSEYILERMTIGGADKICFVVAPGKSDILEYYGRRQSGVSICFAVQPEPAGLCDALFRAAPFIPEGETVCIGLPDTIWYPESALLSLPSDALSFLTFPVDHPEFFDAVFSGPSGKVIRIEVKQKQPSTNWVWGAFKMPGTVFQELFRLWNARGRRDEYIGPLVNHYLENGGSACAVPAGEQYIDVGTFDGYREAVHLLGFGSRPVTAGASR